MKAPVIVAVSLALGGTAWAATPDVLDYQATTTTDLAPLFATWVAPL